jgi:hypothetical protein
MTTTVGPQGNPARRPNRRLPDPGTTGGPPPPGGQPPAGPPAGPPGRPGRGGQGPGYQQYTQYAKNIQADPTQYEQDVIGGKYLNLESNPYVQKYTQGLSRDFQSNLQRGLSEVSSPFLSGATLGQSGIHADVRGRYFSEGMQDLGDTISGAYFDTYNKERDRQTQTSGDLSGRTNQLVSSSASAYGADQQVRQARISADAALKQAKMAQALGYDELASRMMLDYERLNQEAYFAEQQLNLNYAGLAGQTGRAFAGETSSQQGPALSSGGSIAQGAIGGALGGIGLGNMFRGDVRG